MTSNVFQGENKAKLSDTFAAAHLTGWSNQGGNQSSWGNQQNYSSYHGFGSQSQGSYSG